MNNIFSNFLNTLFKEFTNGLLKFLGYCEEINFNELNVFLFYVTGFSILFLLLKFIVGKDENFCEYKKPIKQILIHFVLVSILFKTIEETSIFGAICDYKNNMESNNFYGILFLIFIIYLLIDQIKNFSTLLSKCFSSIFALFDTSKMEKDLKGSMIEILKEIFMIIILNIALVNNINIFILLVILILNNPTTKLKNIFEVET